MSGNAEVDGVVAHDQDESDILDLEDGDFADDETDPDESEDEQADDAEGGESSTDSGDADESDDAEPEQPEPKPTGRDVALQKLQQRQSAFEKQVTDIGTKLVKLTEAIERRGGEPTVKQAEQVKEAKDELSELLTGKDDDDIVDVATLKKLLGRTPDVQKLVKEAIQAEHEAEAQQRRELETYLSQQAEELYEMYPELEGRFDDILDKTTKEVEKRFGKLPQDAFNRRYNFLYPQVAAREAAKASADPKPAPARKAGTKPPKSATGAATKPTSASATRNPGSTSKVVGHDVNIDFIPDFEDDD